MDNFTSKKTGKKNKSGDWYISELETALGPLQERNSRYARKVSPCDQSSFGYAQKWYEAV